MQLKHFSLLPLAGYALAQGPGNAQTLNATLSGNPQLSNLTSILASSPALLAQLSNATNITILAPSNNAFNEFLNSTIGRALANNTSLAAALLQYHVLQGTYTSNQISNSSTFIPTLLNDTKYANVTGGQRVEAVRIGNKTVFYSGLLQNATVSQANLNFTGGVLHVIDSFLTLPASILDTASAANLTSLHGAVNRTNLIGTVDNTRDVTIFAPNNAAFQSVGSALQNLSQSQLANILAYHVVNGTVGYSTSLSNNTRLTAANGQTLTIRIENGTYFVNAARVVTPDILVANGVMHIIDNVLNPNNTAGPSASATTGAPGFSASSATEVPFTSGQPQPSTTIYPSTKSPSPAGTTTRTSSPGAAVPMMTGAVGYGALLGAGAAVFFGGA